MQAQEKKPARPVQGPVGPHLFRNSQESSLDDSVYLEWSPQEPAKRLSKQKRVSLEAPPPAELPLQRWTPTHVAGWMRKAGFDESLIENFKKNDISGGLLQHLQFADLKELGISSFGQRHMLWDEIRGLRGGLSIPTSPVDDCRSPMSPLYTPPHEEDAAENEADLACSTVANADEEKTKEQKLHRRRGRRALRSGDVVSPAESASIVAIEQLLPTPHHCSKGEDCPKWRKYKRRMDRIAKEFPLEMEQIEEANATSSEVTLRAVSDVNPSVVASSDLLGGSRPALRLDADLLRTVKDRDPQENVRQFLNFQHMADSPPEATTPPYEMFPPLSPPTNTQAPHSNLRSLPKLQIPAQAKDQSMYDPDRTIVQPHRSPITAIQDNIYRFASPASAMDMPVTAIPTGPIERDFSNSVPPDMRYGAEPTSRSSSRLSYRPQMISPIPRSQSTQPIERSASLSQRRHHPGFGLAVLPERGDLSPIDDSDEKTPTLANHRHAGWMKKRKTKMLRHEWHENHFRLKGTTLAMHRDSKTLDALEYIDVDEYAVACSSIASKKVNTAFKALKLGGTTSKKKDVDDTAFTFQLIPAAEKKGILGAAGSKTHHFAVKNRDERIDWMRELMLAKALREKGEGVEINVNGVMQ